MTQLKIRVAISGGGLAGATLLHALLKHAHLDVHIFESAAAFREAGMVIGIARNAFNALELIAPSARECLEKAGSVPHHGVKFMLAQGADAGKKVDEIDARKDGKRLTSIVHRAAFLKELVAGTPAERMHASKKLKYAVKNADGSLTLRFEDGSSHDCDVLIGADGVHSVVRKIILGESDPAVEPVAAGIYATLSLQPYEKMRAILGDDYVDVNDPQEWGWLGKDTFVMHNVLSEGGLVQFIASVRTDEPLDGWLKTVPAVAFKEIFHGWSIHLLEALSAVIGDQQEVECICHFEHRHARTYADEPICIMGDAAHATTPWQGSGGGLSIEDALILFSVLGSITSAKQVPAALRIYDKARRPRTQRVVDSSRDTGFIFTGRNPDYTLDYEGLHGRLPSRWDFILDFDNAKARDEAVQKLKAQL